MSFPLLTAPTSDVMPDPSRPNPSGRVAPPVGPAERPYDKGPFDQQFFVEWEVAEAS